MSILARAAHGTAASSGPRLYLGPIMSAAQPAHTRHGPLLVLQTINRRSCTITEKAPTRGFSWLKAATTAFTFKTLLRHYAKRALTPRSLNVKLGPRRKSHKGRAGWLA